MGYHIQGLAAAAAVCVYFFGALPVLHAAPETGFDPAEARAGSLLLRMQQGYSVATRLNTEIDVDVSGLTIRTTLRQSFRNDGNEWVEGVYVFPLPDGAAVDRMRLTVGERVIEGEVREKAEAKAAYEAARSEGRKASLVRQERANLFTTSVANIAPGESISVEIAYLDTAGFDQDTFSLRIPMTLTPRYIPGSPLPDRQGSGWSPDTYRVPDASLVTPPMVATSKDHRVSLTARINAGVPLEFVASRYHPVTVRRDGDAYELTFSGANVPMDHDVELIWRPARESAPRALVFSETVDDRPHLLVMLMPPGEFPDAAGIPPRELVLVIDTSGSMHGVSIEQARRAVLLALDGLRPEDRFNVIQFNTLTDALFPHSVDASIANVEQAKQYVRQLQADGGTEMRPALIRALSQAASEEHLRQVIFVTDGSVGNESELFAVIEDQLGSARLFTVGIGSAPNGWFMRKASESGRGAFVTISALHEVEEKMEGLFRKLEKPMATDIEITWPDGLNPEFYPTVVPDLYAGEPVVVRARLDRAPRPGDLLTLSGRVAGGDWAAEIVLADADPGAGNASMWARARIDSLTDRERRGDDPVVIRDLIVETALAHQIVSRYTSLVAVDKTPLRPSGSLLASEQLPSLMPYGQSTQAIFGFPATATAAPVYRRNGALLMGLGALGLLWQVWTLRGRSREED